MTAARSRLWAPVGKSLSKGDLGKIFANKFKKKIIRLIDDSLNFFIRMLDISVGAFCIPPPPPPPPLPSSG